MSSLAGLVGDLLGAALNAERETYNQGFDDGLNGRPRTLTLDVDDPSLSIYRKAKRAYDRGYEDGRIASLTR